MSVIEELADTEFLNDAVERGDAYLHLLLFRHDANGHHDRRGRIGTTQVLPKECVNSINAACVNLEHTP